MPICSWPEINEFGEQPFNSHPGYLISFLINVLNARTLQLDWISEMDTHKNILPQDREGYDRSKDHVRKALVEVRPLKWGSKLHYFGDIVEK